MNKTIKYQSLFNKYRPALLSEVVGQEVVVTTLKGAIRRQNVANAFLLSGPYGVGKTSIARIIARCVNCLHGILEVPCLTCESCVGIANSSHPDVLEMDAASSTGVDDIRAIIENSKYSPILSRFKVFIIDEVHMLSINAFNALLKTLEEPPAHVKFILATTEFNKVPLTVASRCQRFQLLKVKKEELICNLKKILDKEEKQYDDTGLEIIAKNSKGSVRDSLTLTEKYLMQYGRLTKDVLYKAQQIDLIELWENIFNNNVNAALALFNEHNDCISALQALQQHLYLITKVQLGLDVKQSEFYSATGKELTKKEMQSKFSKVSIELASRAWKILDDGIKECRMAVNTHASSEMLVIRLGYISSLPSPKEIIEKYFKNESQLIGAIKETKIQNELPKQSVEKNSAAQIAITSQHIKELLSDSMQFKELINNLKRIGVLGDIITFYVTSVLKDNIEKLIEEFLSSSLKKVYKIKVINIGENKLVNEVLKEFDGSQIIE